MPIDYSKSMIYKLCCNDLSIKDIYIGSTIVFRKRKNLHKSRCNSKLYDYKVYNFIRNNGGWNNWSMVLVSKTPCNSKLELLQIERKYFEKLNATLNMIYPIRNKKEYIKNNKDHIIKKRKEYYEKNKEVLSKKGKEYRKDNKEIIKKKRQKYNYKEKNKEYYEKNKEKINKRCYKYRKDNKEKIKKKNKEYYEKNKEKKKNYDKTYIEKKKNYDKTYREKNKNKIKEKNKELIKIKIKCNFCNKMVGKYYFNRHIKSKKCMIIQEKNNNIIIS